MIEEKDIQVGNRITGWKSKDSWIYLITMMIKSIS